MTSLFNPKFWLLFLIWTAGIAVFAYQSGHRDERKAAQIRELVITEKARIAKEEADEKVREAEADLTRILSERHTQYVQEQAHAKAENYRLIADVRALRRRLSIPGKCPDHRVEPGADTTIAGGSGTDGRAELDAGAGEFLISIAERGDNAIRKHAEVVERYELARKACAGQAVSQ